MLVNEAWLRLQGTDAAAFANRRHFYASAAKAMRHEVIDYARARQAQRRNSGAEAIPLDLMIEQPIALDAQIERLVQMDLALEKLAQADPRLVQIIELRLFTGLEVPEVAEMLGVSEPTIKRGTRVAKAFLEKEMAAYSAVSCAALSRQSACVTSLVAKSRSSSKSGGYGSSAVAAA